MKWWKRFLLLGAALVLLFAAAIVAHWQYYEYVTRHELARIRAAGEPVTIEELGEHYRATAGDYPQQADWLEVFAEIDRVRDNRRPEDQAFFEDRFYDMRWASIDWFFRQESPKVVEREAFIKRFDTAIRLAQRAAEHPGSIPWDLKKGDTYYRDDSLYLDLSRLCRLLLLASTVHVHQDNPRQAKRELLALLALGRCLESHPSGGSLSGRIYLDAYAVIQTVDAVARVKFDDAELDDLQKAIGSLRYEDHFRRSLLHERVRDLESIDEYLSKGPYGMRIEEGSDNVYSWGAGSKYTYLSSARQMIDAAQVDWKTVYATYQQLRQKQLGSIPLIPTDHDLVRIEEELGPPGYPIELALRATASSRSADALIAIERYRRRHGRLPQSLDELPKELLPAVPIDPIDEACVRYQGNDGWVSVISDRCGDLWTGGFGPRAFHGFAPRKTP